LPSSHIAPILTLTPTSEREHALLGGSGSPVTITSQSLPTPSPWRGTQRWDLVAGRYDPREKEGEPDRRPCDDGGLSKEREDSRADHRADAEEERAADSHEHEREENTTDIRDLTGEVRQDY
jgi:hypothetical protein